MKTGNTYNIGFKFGESPEFTIPQDALAWKVVVKWEEIEQQRLRGMAAFWAKIADVNRFPPYFDEIDAWFEECNSSGSKEAIFYNTDGIYFLTAGVSNQKIYIEIYFGY